MPKISAILVAYNEEKNIIKTIESLLTQTFKDFEIILVDNASTDNTAAVVGKYPVKIVTIAQNLGPGNGRNVGAKTASGEILAFLDGHIIAEPDLFAAATKLYREHKEVGAWGGPTLTPADDPEFAQACGIVLGSWLSTFTMSNRYKRSKINLNANELSITSANFFVRREDFEKTTGFTPGMYGGDDPEFFDRLAGQGTKIGYSPDIFVYNKRRTKLNLFCKQFFNYGKVRPIKEKMHGKMPKIHFWAPSSFLLYMILLPALLLASTAAAIPPAAYFGVMLPYAAYNAAKNNRPQFVGLLLLLYFLIHISYGAGFLYGLYKTASAKSEKNEVMSIAR